MEWITPKTDWMARQDEAGKYAGDYFNTLDFNRLKNNIEFLGAMAHEFWPVFVRAMPDRKYEEYPFADEINTLADNLEAINAFVDCEIGQKTVYEENGAFIGYEDLNRLESACLKLYEAMWNLYTRPVKLPFRLGAFYYPLKNPRIPEPKEPARLRLPFGLGTRLGGAYYPFKAPSAYEEPQVVTELRRLPFRLGDQYFPLKDPEIPREEEKEIRERRLPLITGREYFLFGNPREPKRKRTLPMRLGGNHLFNE